MRPEDDVDEQELNRLLGHLDDPPPRLRAQDVIAAAERPRAFRVRWAAGVVLALGLAGAAYAMPGSPLRRWLQEVRSTGDAPAPPGAPVPQVPEALPVGDPAGVAVDPGQALTIVFAAPQQSGRVTVELVDGSEVVIRASGGAPAFDSGLDRLAIDNRGSSADFEVRIPRGAPRVELRIADHVVFSSRAGRVTTEAAPGPDGVYVLPWSGGGS